MKLDASREFQTLDRIIGEIERSAGLVSDNELVVEIAVWHLKRLEELLQRDSTHEIFDDVEVLLSSYGFRLVPKS